MRRPHDGYYFDDEMTSDRLEQELAAEIRFFLKVGLGAMAIAAYFLFTDDPELAITPLAMYAITIGFLFRSQHKRRLAFTGWQMERERLHGRD